MSSKYIYTSYLKNMTPVDEFDTEKFILEIQKRESIWNVSPKSYNLKCVLNREMKRRAWEEVAKIFNPNWDTLSMVEKQKKVEGLSRKWANMRKYYIEELRKPVNSPPKKRQRRYHHLLTFLDEAVYKRRAARMKDFTNIKKENANNDSTSDSESGELFIVEDDEEHITPPSENSTVSLAMLDDKNKNTDSFLDDKREAETKFNLWDDSGILTKNSNKNTASNTKILEKNPEITKLLNETRGPPPINNNFLYIPSVRTVENSVLPKPTILDQTAEATKKFLLSLLPEVMSLNVKQNLQFRLGIMDLLNDIKLRVNPNVDSKLFPDINID